MVYFQRSPCLSGGQGHVEASRPAGHTEDCGLKWGACPLSTMGMCLHAHHTPGRFRPGLNCAFSLGPSSRALPKPANAWPPR